MPAGTDLITWSPRVGATGDDRYNVEENTKIEVGATSFSSPPTLAEVNAASGINQVIAECKRRYYQLFRSLLATPSYISSESKYSTVLLSTLKTNINTVRTYEYQTSYSFTAFDIKPLRQNLLELRKSLATDHFFINSGILLYSNFNHNSIKKSGLTYPPVASTVIVIHEELWGQDLISTVYHTYRAFLSYDLPVLPTINSAKILIYPGNCPPGDIKTNIYQSSTYDEPLVIGDYGNINTLLAENISLTEDTWNEVTLTNFSFSSEGQHTIVLATKREVDGVTPTGNELFNMREDTGFLYIYPPNLKLYT